MNDPGGGPCCGPSRPQRPTATSSADAAAGPPAAGATDGMLLLDGGEFLMGSDDRDGFAADGEGPVRRVGLSPFWIDPVVVSNARLTSAASALSGPVTISTTGKGRTRISARPG